MRLGESRSMRESSLGGSMQSDTYLEEVLDFNLIFSNTLIVTFWNRMNKILSLLLFRIHVELGMPYPRRQRSQVSSMAQFFKFPTGESVPDKTMETSHTKCLIFPL